MPTHYRPHPDARRVTLPPARRLMTFDELRPKEQRDQIAEALDEAHAEEIRNGQFFRVQKMLFHLGEVISLHYDRRDLINSPDAPHGTISLTNTSSVLVWITDDGESVQTLLTIQHSPAKRRGLS